MKKHKRRKTKQFSLIKISKHTKMEFLSQSNSCSISDSFLDEYTEDEACNRFDITKNVWIKISHVVSHWTIFQYLENDKKGIVVKFGNFGSLDLIRMTF